jgi:hypothetical protein
MPYQKVYYLGLQISMEALRSYITKWQPQLQKSLTSDQYTCVLDVLTAITSCLHLLPGKRETPDV